jgi:outer membrane cobalamin receptor
VTRFADQRTGCGTVERPASGIAGRSTSSKAAILGTALFCSLFPCHVASAAEGDSSAGSSGNNYGLGEVIVVTGKTRGVQATEVVSAVTSEDIQNKGAKTLDQALSLLPGVNIRTGGDGVPRIDIRGFRTRHVLLLLDGIPINSAVDQQFDPALIPTENIAAIKLTEGASSVLHGQGGLGGVINIITKKGTAGLQGAVAAETGDHAPYAARASVSGGEGPFDFLLSGSSSRVNGFPLSGSLEPTSAQPAGYRYNSDRKRSNAFGNVGFAPTDDLSLGLTVNYVHAELGKPSTAIDDPFDPFASTPRYERVPDSDMVSVQAATDYQATARLRLRGWAFVNHLSEQDNRYDDASYRSVNLISGSFQQQVKSTIVGASLQPKYDLGRAGVVAFLLSAERDSWVNSGSMTVDVDTFVPVGLSRALNIYSAAVEYELSPLKGLGLVAGYGHHWQVRVGEKSEDDTSVLAAAYYDVLEDTRLKASYNRNIRFPSLRDLHDPSQGNSDLVAERATTYSAGVEQKLPWHSLASANAFTTQARNLIQTDQATGRSANLADVRFKGFEVAASTRFVRPLLLRGSYAFLDSQDRSRAGRDQQQYTPRDKVALEATCDFAFGLQPYVSLAYVGNQYFYTRNAVTPVQKGKLADYTLVNVKLSQRLVRDRLTLHLGVSNLLDQYYETSYGFPQAGRFVYGGFELRI